MTGPKWKTGPLAEPPQWWAANHTWYAVRIDDRNDTHPNYVGPLKREDADNLCARLSAAHLSFEAGKLYSETDLPGLAEAIKAKDKR